MLIYVAGSKIPDWNAGEEERLRDTLKWITWELSLGFTFASQMTEGVLRESVTGLKGGFYSLDLAA